MKSQVSICHQPPPHPKPFPRSPQNQHPEKTQKYIERMEELYIYIFWRNNCYLIMKSSNGNIFRVTGHLCGMSFDIFFDLRLNKRLNDLWLGWWFETQSRPLWLHCKVQGERWQHRGCDIWEWGHRRAQILLANLVTAVCRYFMWPLLLTWVNFNPSMDKLSHAQ